MSLLPNAKPVNCLPNGEHSGQVTSTDADSTAMSGSSWQRELAAATRSPSDLLAQLRLTRTDFPEAISDSDLRFPLLVPQSYIQRMNSGEPCDPLLRQVLPVDDETHDAAGFILDAVGDEAARTAPGLLQKYQGRALLVTTGSCAIHCRYCFRREYPYQQEPRRLEHWDDAIDKLSQDTSISEVILSGGDPLMLPDARLEQLVSRVDAMSHIRRIRFHTRLPIVLPSRITQDFRSLCDSLNSQPIMVVHANHANEIASDCRDTLRKLVRWGMPVLNQSVLLRGINDTAEAQISLSRALIDIGVMPYYLHQLDRVKGTAHFEVPLETARHIIQQMRTQLPGYAIPQLVQEIPGELSKTPLES